MSEKLWQFDAPPMRRLLPPSAKRPPPSRLALVSTVVAMLSLVGCQSGPDAVRDTAAGGPASPEAAEREASGESLHDLIHRYVLASPVLDECVVEWGLGPENRFEISFQAMPSGELRPLGVKGEQDELNACLRDAVAQIRLPAGSVTEPKTISVSIR